MPPKLRSQTAAASPPPPSSEQEEEVQVNHENQPVSKEIENEVEQENAEPPAPAVQEGDKITKSKKPQTTFSPSKRPTKLKPQNPHLAEAEAEEEEEVQVNNENHPEAKEVEEEVEQENAKAEPPPPPAAVQEDEKIPKSKKPKTTFNPSKRPIQLKSQNPHLAGEEEEQENDKIPKSKKPKPTLTPAKRPTGEKTHEDKKSEKHRKKNDDSVEVEETKKKRKKKNNKIWSEEEEVGILKEMLKFLNKAKGLDMDLEEFLGSIKNSVHLVDVTNDQLSKKIRSMNETYTNNSNKEKEGKKLNFSNTHDAKLYELSKMIWCPVKRMEAEKNRVEVDSVVEKEKEEQNLLHSISSMNKFMQRGKVIVNANKAKVLERKWKKLQITEAKVFLERIEFIKSYTEVVLDSLIESSSSN